ncbi:MAG: hypothetical protein HGA87_00095 [Desulfobulbaceae bacterium]|nr:hypothetical protein [Desulfobulbaceae bacterium]
MDALSRIYSAVLLPQKAKAYIENLVGLFDEFSVSVEQTEKVFSVCRETEFQGTAFSPLPDETALVRIIKDVKHTDTINAQYRQYQPQTACGYVDGDCEMICSDGEVIVRDKYFFRNMFELSDMCAGHYPKRWIEEAFAMMDAAHQAQYRSATDRRGRVAVMQDYFSSLDLPARETYSYNEVGSVRERSTRWSRYK